MHNNFTIINKQSSKKVTMMLTGVVSSYDSQYTFKAATFINEFRKLQEKYNHIHIDIVNFYGGSINEGIPVYNHIKETVTAGVIKITGKIDGLAASMGSIIAMAIDAKDLEMGNMARLMNHSAKGGVYGTAQEVRNAADLIDDYENDLVNILAERTGWSSKKVKSEWMDGMDHYIKAEQAKKLNLVGKIAKSKAIKKEPKNLSNPQDIYNFYHEQIVNTPTIKHTEEMKKITLFIAAFLKAGIELPNDVTEEGIYEATNQLISKNKNLGEKLKNLETKIEENEKQTLDSLITDALQTGKITKDQEEFVRSMAKNDLESVSKFIKKQKVYRPLSDRLNQGNQGGQGNQQNDPEKTFNWYRKNAPADLENIKRNTPELYDSLKNAQFGSK